MTDTRTASGFRVALRGLRLGFVPALALCGANLAASGLSVSATAVQEVAPDAANSVTVYSLQPGILDALAGAPGPAQTAPRAKPEEYVPTAALPDSLQALSIPAAILDLPNYLDPDADVPPGPAAPAGALAVTPTASGAGQTSALGLTQVAQLRQLLVPLVGQEFTSRRMFEAALDEQLCVYADDLVRAAEKRDLSSEEVRAIVAPPWDDAKGMGKLLRRSDIKTISLGQLPALLLPKTTRDWVVQRAAVSHALGYGTPVAWAAGDQGCYLGGLWPVLGFYPLWRAENKVQDHNPDFSVLKRLSLFAFGFDRNGVISAPWVSDPKFTKFLKLASDHRTQVDFTIYQDDWSFLPEPGAAGEGEALEKLAGTLAANTLSLVNQPLPEYWGNVKDPLSYFEAQRRLAQGVTLWLVPPAQANRAAQFADFYKRYADKLMQAMNRDPQAYHYGLNLVICGPGFFRQDAFRIAALRRFSDQAESMDIDLRFIVPIPLPISKNVEALRQQVLDAAGDLGGARNLSTFLEKVAPLLYLSADLSQTASADLERKTSKDLADRLGFIDSFYSTAFWPAPMRGQTLPKDMDSILWEKFIPPGGAPAGAIVQWFSLYYRYVRVLFCLLALVFLVALPVVLRYRLGDFNRIALLGFWGATFLLVVVAGVLLECDPGLEKWRQGNVPLWSLIVIELVIGLVVILTPRVEEP